MIEPLDIQDLMAEAEAQTAPVNAEDIPDSVARTNFINGALMQYVQLLAEEINRLEARIDQLS
jgi:hypothetical protein